jgi:hypothetical protein
MKCNILARHIRPTICPRDVLSLWHFTTCTQRPPPEYGVHGHFVTCDLKSTFTWIVTSCSYDKETHIRIVGNILRFYGSCRIWHPTAFPICLLFVVSWNSISLNPASPKTTFLDRFCSNLQTMYIMVKNGIPLFLYLFLKWKRGRYLHLLIFEIF